MDFDTHFRGLAAEPADAVDSDEVEIACSDLLLTGRLVLGQFRRLSDLFNHSLGYYMVVRNARLLEPNRHATDLELAEMMIKREDITFVGQAESAVQPKAGARAGMSSFDRPMLAKIARRLVFYTPGSSITANVHMFEEMTLSTFLEGREPLFIPTTSANVRSLADRAVTARFGLLLVNRLRIMAAAEADLAGAAAD